MTEAADLLVFLRARLDEDEAAANAAASVAGPDWGYNVPGWDRGTFLRAVHGPILADMMVDEDEIGPFLALHDPDREHREIEAKRARLALMIQATAEMDRLLASDTAGRVDQAMAVGRARAAATAVKYDAAVWHDHADYQPEWKP